MREIGQLGRGSSGKQRLMGLLGSNFLSKEEGLGLGKWLGGQWASDNYEERGWNLRSRVDAGATHNFSLAGEGVRKGIPVQAS